MDKNNLPNLTHFKVVGLHGDRDIEMNFDGPVKILLSENGSGKTTAMNLLIGALSGSLRKAATYEFQYVELGFRSGVTVVMSRKELLLLTDESEIDNDPRMREVKSDIGEDNFDKLVDLAFAAGSGTALMADTLFEKADRSYPGPSESFAERLIDIAKSRSQQSDEQRSRRKEITEAIDKNFRLKILYLPTYRRVEEDIRNDLSIRRRSAQQEQLINFGMRDVEELIASITDDIKKSSISSYQRTSAEMLNQLSVDDLPSQAQIADRLGRADDLNLVLGRLKSIISAEAKKHILDYINTGEIFSERRQTLAFFLSNLITIYDQTKIQDEKIKAFMLVVNSYLVGKEFIYDDINVRLQMVNKRTGLPLMLERLSSGEKQLVSVLAQLYLRDEGDFAVFFDEPELSLSMEWQERLLPDILASKKCGLLVVATHSPFMFNNDLKCCVEALKVDFLSPSQEA
jgi:predicted ATPase